MPRREIPELNETLNQIDAECFRQGTPLLSALVIHEDGMPCSTFIHNVDRYGLRWAGEADDAARERIAEECHVYYGGKHG